MNPVMQLIRSALSRLENSPQPENVPAGNTVPGQDVVIAEDAQASRLVYVIQKAPEVAVQVTEERPVPPKRWPVFVAGMATALVLSAATAFGWQVAHRPDKAISPMAASVAWVPVPMTPAQIEAFRRTESSQTDARMWLARMSSQVSWITTLAPGWRLRYGQGLVSQAKALWPDDPATRALVNRWEQYQAGRALPASQLTGWHDGMMQLQALSAQLDALDRQKGKYMTGSELKAIVWRITSTFASAVPVEEQLRQLVPAAGEANAPQANIEQAARHLDSLIHVLEQQSAPKADIPGVKPITAAE